MSGEINKKCWVQNSLMFAVGIVGVIYAIYLGLSVHNADKESLLTRTSTIAHFITASDVALLNGSKEDLNNPTYIKLKEDLISVRSVNPDIRFIYLNGMRDGKVFFYADSEDVDSPDYSPPGQQYDEASSLLRSLFQKKENGFEVASDRWGAWASIFVPIVDEESGKVVAILGTDIPAKKYMTDIFTYCLSALLFSALTILLIIGQKNTVTYTRLAEDSLKANKLEIMNLEKIINEKEQKAAKSKKKIPKT
jgi:hypothetical protein